MNAIKLPFQFDPEKLLAEYNSVPKADYHEIHNTYVTPHKLLSTHLIDIEDAALGNDKFIPNDRLKGLPHMLEIYETFKCEKSTYRIHELLPDSYINEHRDIGFCYEQGTLRIHIPVVTSPEISMRLNGEEITMLPGEAWYLDFDLPHAVTNTSDKSRTHLIMDCVSNEWWDEIMKEHGKSRGGDFNRMSAEDLERMKAELANMDSDVANEILKSLGG
jgi:hypothetical protein